LRHSVGVDVYKFGGGEGDEKEEEGGNEEETSRIHVDKKNEEKDEEEVRLPDSLHHGQYEARLLLLL